MRVIIDPRAEKQLKRLPKTFQVIVGRKIRQLGNPTEIQVEQLTGYKKVYKIRVGNYRIVYKSFTDRKVVFLIGHRREVYKLLDRLLRF
ncbi:hypothetical protein A2630_01320 [Candidatus Woesebacteria bacterium RIFCSPHIGHO2_01_FULL_44_10]|uniref:Uncharacterized protein n=1 Tax=Candidatus Woesebacteria bacterium RIFCSPLOWO2_01_FULL_44_14 TaxID=1802525 RepID=A0A1F8C196_9BACT|nr:MAG: hypothetical protein A2630_01320 [Candidatus Woesebacteria bacterium RIFCSPHIGHO2_01_FULL_44_10]OGM55681.1 MAG: hypothetical protein A3F62_02560 [Candidatus Woesebacteria bacterium RIFCSPHIGHO2_12_FULL_44_11]OGM70107.1 MAG: hypothetical protein A2975_03460 [Candidatus Woesebacteria bacterium RIFCSPLOWO2_01_FULL_44_14]